MSVNMNMKRPATQTKETCGWVFPKSPKGANVPYYQCTTGAKPAPSHGGHSPKGPPDFFTR